MTETTAARAKFVPQGWMARFFPRWFAYRSSRKLYNYLAGITSDLPEWRFLNLGYVPLDPAEPVPDLNEADERCRLHIQLYTHLAAGVDFSGKDVLEVGCGRGGGAEFLMRSMRPRTMTGLDLSRKNVELASGTFLMEGLSYRRGNAEAMPLSAESFDVVLNVESSHCYPRIEKFYGETHRVLRPGGLFRYADILTPKRRDFVADSLRKAGFVFDSPRDITKNVLGAIQNDNERRERILRGLAQSPEEFRWLAGKALLVGTVGYRALADGTLTYWSYAMRKS